MKPQNCPVDIMLGQYKMMSIRQLWDSIRITLSSVIPAGLESGNQFPPVSVDEYVEAAAPVILIESYKNNLPARRPPGIVADYNNIPARHRIKISALSRRTGIELITFWPLTQSVSQLINESRQSASRSVSQLIRCSQSVNSLRRIRSTSEYTWPVNSTQF